MTTTTAAEGDDERTTTTTTTTTTRSWKGARAECTGSWEDEGAKFRRSDKLKVSSSPPFGARIHAERR
jgi:hypothetical protein